MRFRGKVEQGKLKLLNRDIFISKIQEFNGKNVEVWVKERKSQRSLNQNAYYWGVVIDILSKEIGYTPAQMHTILKYKFLQEEMIFEIKERKEILKGSKSSADLNTKEFEQYLTDIRIWASTDLQISIPEPNESDYLSYEVS